MSIEIDFELYDAEIQKQIIKTLDSAVHDCAMDLKRESVNQAPIDTGALRRSAYVYKTKELEREVGYDKNNAKGILGTYAIVQHERNFNHPNGGKWKYLEDPYNERKERYEKYIEQALEDFVNGFSE